MWLIGKFLHSNVNKEQAKNMISLAEASNNYKNKAGTTQIILHSMRMIYKHYRFCYWHKKRSKNNHKTKMALLILLLLLLLSGDIELNPGPKSIYTCGICGTTKHAYQCVHKSLNT